MAFTTVTVVVDFTLADGTEPTGTVTFTPSAALYNTATVVVAAPVTRTMSATGVVSVPLVANTDPGTTPADSYYTVYEQGSGWTRTRRIVVPHYLGSTVELYDLGETAPPVPSGGNTPAGVATGTGTTGGGNAKVAVVAARPTGTGAANSATVSTASQGQATAGLASGTGTAYGAFPSVPTFADTATGTGTARQPTVSTGANASPSAGLAVGTGAANNAAAKVSAPAEAATGTGTARQPTISTGTDVPTADMEVWYKADAITGLSDGDLLTAWPDSSGNGYVTNQPISTHAPAYKTGIVNGKPVVRFSATRGDAVRSSAPTSASDQTLFVVLKPNSGSLSGTPMIRNPDVGALLLRLSSGKIDLVRAGVAIIGTGGTTLSSSSFSIICGTYSSATSWAVYLNGTADGSGSTTVTLTSGGVMNGLGSDGIFGGNSFDGDIAELITYSAVLGSTDRGTVTSYLQSKYGI